MREGEPEVESTWRFFRSTRLPIRFPTLFVRQTRQPRKCFENSLADATRSLDFVSSPFVSGILQLVGHMPDPGRLRRIWRTAS